MIKLNDLVFDMRFIKNPFYEKNLKSLDGKVMETPIWGKSVKINYEDWTGYAFGMGVERMTMLRYGIKDIRLFYNGDIRVLRQFR